MNKAYLNTAQAIALLPEEEYIHTFYNNDFGLVGADWSRGELISKIGCSDIRELTGPKAMAMEHGLVVYNKGARHENKLFIQTDMTKVEELEKALSAEEVEA